MSDLISRQAAIDAIHCDITITGRQNRRDDDPYVMGSEPQIEVTYDEQKRR